MNKTISAIAIQKGDTIVGTKKLVMARIHALSNLQQKGASASVSRAKKVSDMHVDFVYIYVCFKASF